MANFQVIRRSHIEDEFEGFDEDMLFQLVDGTCWLQSEYKYWYHYAYRPRIELLRDGGRILLRLEGRTESVAVTQLSGVIESQIADAFNGWDGKSEYKLTNGQVWKQDRYKYEYKHAYRPRVIIYDTPSGTVMSVAGTKAIVRRSS